MKRPSFQFYPGDWQSNSNLRRCSHAEKGVWLDILCLLHDQPEYGILRWPLKEIAQAVSASVGTVKALITKGVFKGDDKLLEETFTYTPRSGRRDGETVTLVAVQNGPIWYSSRMVKDEYIRTIRGESTRFGVDGETSSQTPNTAPKASPKPPFGDGSSSSTSSSASQIPVAKATDGDAVKPADMTKDELWKAGKSLLSEAGMPRAQCGTFVGKLVKDYGDTVVIDAVRTAVLTRPADPASYLKATCQTTAGQRQKPAYESPYSAAQRQKFEAAAPMVAAQNPNLPSVDVNAFLNNTGVKNDIARTDIAAIG